MWSAYEQIVSNQPGDVRRQRSIPELLPARICQPPNINGKGDAFRNCAERCEYQAMPIVCAGRKNTDAGRRIRGNAYNSTLCFGLEPTPRSISHSLTVAPMTSALSSCK